MRTGGGVLPATLPWRLPLTDLRSVTLPRVLIYAACTALALICSYVLGEDVGWDTLNYHLYAGWSAVHDRLSQDYFAAGPPSYFSPYAYAPFYVLVSSGLPALAVASILALAHSTVLWLTYETALCACPSLEPRIRVATGACAVALAFLNPILIQQIGSSFSDITTAALVLWGWLLLARALQAPRDWPIVCAGLLLGAASALKLTNAVHSVSACALLLFLPGPLLRRLRYGLGYGLSLGLGFAVVAAPWAYPLALRFGNPFFPLMNGVFRSPEFTTETLRHFRFVPADLGDALWRPFAIADPTPTVQVELLAPDIRYAVLLLVSGFVAARWLWRRRRPVPGPPGAHSNTRVLVALGSALAVDWILWLLASGNGRYFLPMASIAAVVIVALLFRAFAAQPKVRNYALAAILAIQVIQLWMGTDYRSAPLPWGGPWFQVSTPQKLATEPSLYLTLGIQSNSFIAPYLAPDSGLINLSGGYTLGSQGANGAHVDALLRRYAARVRMLTTGARLYTEEDGRGPLRSQVDDALEQFGLRVDPGDCATISVRGVPPPLEIHMVGKGRAYEPEPRDTTHLVSCRVVAADPADTAARLAQRRAADLVLDRLEDACPALFQPQRLQTVHVGNKWQRLYMNTDLLAWVSNGEVKFRDESSADYRVRLGRVSDWTKAPLKLACGRRGRHYFAQVLELPPGL